MKKPLKQPDIPSSGKDRLDAMLDEPSRNQRYGGMTMCKMVRKVVLRRNDQAEMEPAEIKIERR